jgi:hypothetical protein
MAPGIAPKRDFIERFQSDLAVQTSAEKISLFIEGKSVLFIARPASLRGAYHDRHER